MEDERRATRLVAYALFSELGSPEPKLHVVDFGRGIGLVVYADCIGGRWTIYHTPLVRDVAPFTTRAGTVVPALRIDGVRLVRSRPKRTPRIFRIDSGRVSNAGRTRTWIALALLRNFTPINVPANTSIGSGSSQPALLSEHDQAQLEVYRRIAQHFRAPYKRYGRTLLSILRTWGVVGDDVSVDRQLMDVIYKTNELTDSVALTFEELDELVDAAVSAHVDPHGPNSKLKSVVCTDTEPPIIKLNKGGLLAAVINTVLDSSDPAKGLVLFARPAAEIAAIFTPAKAAENQTNSQFTEVQGWDETLKTQDLPAVVTDETALRQYWALVYRMLMWQTLHARACLDRYKAWYSTAFEHNEPAYVVWYMPHARAHQSVGTVPLMSYVRTKPKSLPDIVGKDRPVIEVFQRTSRAAFKTGTFVVGGRSVIWDGTESLVSVSARAGLGLYGPYYTEKELTRVSSAAQSLGAHVERKDRFRVYCKRPVVTKATTDANPLEVGWEAINGVSGAGGLVATIVVAAEAAGSYPTITTALGLAGGLLGQMGTRALTFVGNAPLLSTGALAASTNAELLLAKYTEAAALAAATIADQGLQAASGAALAAYNVAAAAAATAATAAAVPTVTTVAAGGAVVAGLVYGATKAGPWINGLRKRRWAYAQQKVQAKKDKMGLEEKSSAGIPLVNETFNLEAFLVDTSSAMCEVALSNAILAAEVVTST